MKTLILYYSRNGHTKKVAEAISNSFKCDIEEVIDQKNRKGILGWIFAGRDATLGNLTKINDLSYDVSAYDTIIIGTPVWAGNMAPAIRTMILQYEEQFKNVAFFCTEGGSGGERAIKKMEKLAEKNAIAKLIVTEGDIKSGSYSQKEADFLDTIRKSR